MMDDYYERCFSRALDELAEWTSLTAREWRDIIESEVDD